MECCGVNPAYVAVSGLASFIIVYYTVSWWIGVAERNGLVGRDMNKPDHPSVAEAGGVWVAVAASFGLMILIALYRYVDAVAFHLDILLALSLLLFMSSFLGFMDDLLGWKKGLRVWQRIVFAAPLSLPLVVVKAGVSSISLPFIGAVNLGLLYPLLLIPAAVVGAANAYNMLAGYNGLEAGLAAELMVFTAIYTFYKGITHIFYASVIMLAALLGFLIYNWYPARVFPGNSFTYGFGAYYASLLIAGNFEKYGATLFTLYFIELLLFIRGLLHGVYKENFGRVMDDGSLRPPYDKAYSVTHLAIMFLEKTIGRATEKHVVYTILSWQALIGAAALYLYLYLGV